MLKNLFCRLIPVLALIALATVAATSANAQGGTTTLQLQLNELLRLQVVQGKSVIVSVPGKLQKIVVGNPGIADAIPLSDNTFYVLGKVVGTTNIQILDGNSAVPLGVIDVTVGIDVAEVEGAIMAAVPEAKVAVASLNGRLRLSGEVPDQLAMQRVREVAQQFSADPVIDALRVITPKQVSLRVRIVEASRSISKDIGVQFGQAPDGLNTTGRFVDDNAEPFGDFVSRVIGLGFNVDIALRGLEERGLARNLASPTLVALSGETASFLAGGELPIVIKDDSGGSPTVSYKEYGVRLSFTPKVLDNNIINMKLEPEVSQLDFAKAEDGYPSFSTRRASTTVELKDGESFVIAGLLQSNRSRQRVQVPGMGDVPVVGALFRSSSLKDSETDLIIIVTPVLTDPGQTSIIEEALRSDTRPANDTEFFLLGADEVSTYSIEDALNGIGITGNYGHMLDDSLTGTHSRK